MTERGSALVVGTSSATGRAASVRFVVEFPERCPVEVQGQPQRRP